MARIYVVNASAQEQMLYYRFEYSLDTNGNKIDGRMIAPRFQVIPAGTQQPFAGELLPGQVQELVEQLEKAGAVHVDAIRTAKAKGVVKLVWSLDKPVPRPICDDVKEHNTGYLSAEGVARRRRLAIAADFSLRGIGKEIGSERAPNLQMEVETLDDGKDEGTAPRLEEGFRVDPRAVPPPQPKGRSRWAA